jgi:hypothetical protein
MEKGSTEVVIANRLANEAETGSAFSIGREKG